LRAEFECRRQHGFDVEFLDRRKLGERTSIRSSGAIVSCGDAQINPLEFTERLMRAAADAGARVHEQTMVERVDESATEVVAQTVAGRIRAGRIIYTTGYQLRPFLVPNPGKLLSTYAAASGPGLVVDGWPDGSLIWETRRPYFYARRTDDGRVIMGGADTPFARDHDCDPLLDRKIDRLRRRFERLFPGTNFEPEFAWGGTFAETKDGLAYIGTPPGRPRAYFALGYGGNGITFGVIAARLLADLILGRPNPDAEVFRFGR
jgi:glycine/D-amino acid oxidase-like deaminating enzyme